MTLRNEAVGRSWGAKIKNVLKFSMKIMQKCHIEGFTRFGASKSSFASMCNPKMAQRGHEDKKKS